MAHKSEAPAARTGATRDKLGGWSRILSTLGTYRGQFLIGAQHVRPELAAMIAALAFGGRIHG